MALIVLTIFNVTLFAFQIHRLRSALGGWRKVLAALPTPMLGFASSYGVYAFNLMYVPPWVAAIMAAAYETTYIGIAALDGLDDKQRARGKKIMMSAAWISFSQNAIAGAFHAVPDVRAHLSSWPMAARIALYGVGALLHAAQVWVAYHAADFTLHRPAAQAVTAMHDGDDDKPSVKTLRSRPSSMRRSVMTARMLSYPRPERVNTEPLTKKQGLQPDPRADQVRHMRDAQGMDFQEIALHLDLKSRQSAHNLYKYGRTYAPRKAAQ
jgi:hypothetical protein